MKEQGQKQELDVFPSILSIAFLIGLIVFELGLYFQFSQDGSPWLIMIVMNALYIIGATIVIGGLSIVGWFGMLLGYVISIVGLFVIGISSF